MKNVLFIGDFRTAMNYGSIATTESLLKLIDNYKRNNAADIEVKTINSRSFDNNTPINGFDSQKKKFSILRMITPYKIIQFKQKKGLKKLNKIERLKSLHVPYRFNLFETYFERMKKGEILQYEKQLLEWADLVIINGEGGIVNGTDKFGIYHNKGRYIIYLAWLSKFKYNLPTAVVNHTVDPKNSDAFEMIQNVYPYLDYVFVRETRSLKQLEEFNVNNAKFVPDALFTYKPTRNKVPTVRDLKIDFTKPYICLGDSSALKRHMWSAGVKWDVEEFYTELIYKLKKITPQIVFVNGFTYDGSFSDSRRFAAIEKVIKRTKIQAVSLANCNYHELALLLKNSELFISGRWHSSILSLVVNTPILLWGADSHKTRALYEIIGYRQPYFELASLPIHIDDIVKAAQDIINNRSKIMKEVSQKVENLSIEATENIRLIIDHTP